MDLVALGAVHYEPMGIFAGNSSDLAALPDGAKVGVPNDATNEARALLLLESNGLITLKEDAGVAATKLDIVENPHNLEIVEMEAAQLPLSLSSLDIAVINGNYALSGGLSISDALAIEEADSLAAETYQNVVAVRNGDETRPELQTLMEKPKSFVYQGFGFLPFLVKCSLHLLFLRIGPECGIIDKIRILQWMGEYDENSEKSI